MLKKVMFLSLLLMSINCTNLKAMNQKVVIGSLLASALIPFIHDRYVHPEGNGGIGCDITSNILLPLPLTYLIGRELKKGHKDNALIVFPIAFCAVNGVMATYRYFEHCLFHKKCSKHQ